jgi:hypothetical protein
VISFITSNITADDNVECEVYDDNGHFPSLPIVTVPHTTFERLGSILDSIPDIFQFKISCDDYFVFDNQMYIPFSIDNEGSCLYMRRIYNFEDYNNYLKKHSLKKRHNIINTDIIVLIKNVEYIIQFESFVIKAESV